MPIVVAVAVPVAVLFRPARRTSDFFPEVDFGPTPAEQTAVNGKVCEEVYTDRYVAVSYTHLTLPTTPYV